MLSRRSFIGGALAASAAIARTRLASAEDSKRQADRDQALVAITLDLEMSRNFPRREVTHWDYEKGNLNDETKRYTAEACRRVKARGGVLHCFVVGRTLEQENVDWLKQIAAAGHPLGNHTYDHVNITAKQPGEIQPRFQRAPWLIEGRSVEQVIRENIRLTNVALRERIGVDAAGFRTPGGFANGLIDRPDLQNMLLELGFKWVSSKYPRHKLGPFGSEPTSEVLDGIVAAQQAAQPFVYPSGLVEVPMSPMSDIGAFRNGGWKLDSFLTAIRGSLAWCIDNRAVFDFLSHPSCLYVTDPDFKAIDLICGMVEQAGNCAKLVGPGTIAATVSK